MQHIEEKVDKSHAGANSEVNYGAFAEAMSNVTKATIFPVSQEVRVNTK